MSDGRRALGGWGESVAATWLEAHGYTVEQRNWRCPSGEIDLVARRGEWLAFVEVKTRRGAPPETAITRRKARKLVELAYAYLQAHDLDDVPFTIDVMAVELDRSGKLVRCDHYEGAVGEW